jgi:hypothetical protein
MTTNAELLKDVYQAFNARQIDTVLARMHPEVDWPNGMEGGRVMGHPGVRDYWLRQWAIIDPHVDPVGFAADHDGRTVVTVHQVIRDLDGKVLMDRLVEHIYAIKDGLILNMEIRELANQPA